MVPRQNLTLLSYWILGEEQEEEEAETAQGIRMWGLTPTKCVLNTMVAD